MEKLWRRLLVGWALLVMPGCAWLNTPVGVDPPDAAREEQTVSAPPPASTPRSTDTPPVTPENTEAPPAKPPPPAPSRPPASEGSASRPNPPAPVLSVRMTAEEESRLRQQITDDMARANEAVGLIRQKALTREQNEDLSVVVDFLKGALAARDTDLKRAGTLAQKARILAEQLKATVSR